MRGKRVLGLPVSVLMLVSMFFGGTAGGTQGKGVSIALTVSETAGIARSAEPVTCGIPVPRASSLMSADGLHVTDGAGREVPSQFQVTSRWGGGPTDARKPVRWLLVDFEADVAAGQEARYTVSAGAGGPPSTGLGVARNDSSVLQVTTGAADFTFNKKKFNLLDSVRVGASEIVSTAGRTGIVAQDTRGRTYASYSKAPRSVTLETDGPVRKTVKIQGAIAGASGELLDCVARVSLFAGKSDAKIQVTVRNPRGPRVVEGQPDFCDIGCPNSADFENLDLVVGCTQAGTARLGGLNGGDLSSAGSLSVYQDSSGGGAWNKYRGRHPRPQSFVSFRGYRAYSDGALASSGNRPKPWLGTAASRGGAVASVRDFWQNYPKAIRGAGGRIEVSLFPGEYAGPYSFRPGEQKTHEVTVCFHGPGGESAARSRAAAAQDPLVASASVEQYMTSGAMGRVTGPTGDGEFDSYEALNRATLDGGTGTDLFDVIEDAEFYSWQDFGEEPVDYENGGTGSFNQKYNFDLGMIIQWMRTGDARWWRLAEAAGKHTADLDIYHHAGAPGAWYDGGFFGHSYHDEENDLNPNRNYGKPHPDLVFGAPGLFQRYYMTGDPVALESAREISDNIRWRFDNSFGRGNGEGYAEVIDYENGCLNARPFAHGLWVLVEAYRGTGDAGYLSTAEWLIRNSHQATDLFITRPVAGDTRYTKLFCWDLLVSSLGRYLDLCAEMGRADESGAKEQLVAMTRQEAQVMWKRDASGNRGVPYAWRRDGTPWGWEESEVAVNVCNWHLLTADSMTYGFLHGGDSSMLDRAREAFKTGSDPELEYYEPIYTATKEATNSAIFGLAYMNYRYPPGVPVASTQFDEWLCLENPGSRKARVTIEYFTGEGRKLKQGLEVPPASRSTVDVRAAVGAGQDVSARVISSKPIVAERPMYFDYHGAWKGGHVASGALESSRDWYFAEGCTRAGFEEWITIANAGDAAGDVTLTYMMEGGARRVQKVNAAAGSRTTVNVTAFVGEGHDISTHVSSTVPVVAERPMYFDYHGAWDGGHDVLGAAAPAETWYFGEGTTRQNPDDGSYEEWLCLQNPSRGEAHTRIDFLLDGGGAIRREYALAPMSRTTVDVMREVGPNRDVSVVVASDVPIVAERPMYFATRQGWDGGDVALGSTELSATRHFAEGCTRAGFQTWLSIGNPQAEEATVTITYYLASGAARTRRLTVPASGRSTVDVNLDVGPEQDVSCKVTSSAPVMVERPMYFDYHASRPGGHDGTGAAAPAVEWYFAEGCTR